MHKGYWDIYGHTHVYLGDDDEALHTWGRMMDDIGRRTVEVDEVKGIGVSTVFLGADHGFSGPPLLFETMCFPHDGGDKAWDHYTNRYPTWDSAAQGHARIVTLITAGKKPPHAR